MSKQLTIEELLAKAEDKSKQRLRVENNVNTLKYIERVGWKAGTYAVPTCVIFWHYRTQYTGTHLQAKVKKIVFFRTFGKQFRSYRDAGQRYYLLNEGVINVTPELLKECRAYDKQHWQKAPRKKKEVVQLPRQEGDDSN